VSCRRLMFAEKCQNVECKCMDLTPLFLDMGRMQMMRKSPNHAAPANAPVAPRFQVGHTWRRVTEQRRSAAEGEPLVLLSGRGFAHFYFDAGNVEQHRR
jgi:hypothetical protein